MNSIICELYYHLGETEVDDEMFLEINLNKFFAANPKILADLSAYEFLFLQYIDEQFVVGGDKPDWGEFSLSHVLGADIEKGDISMKLLANVDKCLRIYALYYEYSTNFIMSNKHLLPRGKDTKAFLASIIESCIMY